MHGCLKALDIGAQVPEVEKRVPTLQGCVSSRKQTVQTVVLLLHADQLGKLRVRLEHVPKTPKTGVSKAGLGAAF
jgi:hypothetical protein